jgi:antitoxin HicB
MAKRKYTISDGKLVLTLQPDEDGWYVVTSPTDPAMITQARTIPEAFELAADAFAALAASRADVSRWNRPSAKASRRRTA